MENVVRGGANGWSRWRMAMWGVAAFLLLLPLVAMQFTREVNWEAGDFLVMGIMLTVACGTCEMAARISGNGAYRAAVGIAVVISFLLVWINLAVGIIGTEDNVLNLMYGGVIAVAVVGSLVAGFRAAGMAKAMFAAAAAQLLVAVVGQIEGHFTWGLTLFFVLLWLVSAGLFRKASEAA